MPPMSRRAAGQVVQAEVALQQSLQKCLINLPASLVSVLVNANTVAQNVVVELTYRQANPANNNGSNNAPSIQKSIFAGWTGLQSRRKLAPLVGKDGFVGSRGASSREQDVAVVEVDATFGRLLGLTDGQKVGVILHLDPPQAHTINIEPLTPADWEMVELHAQFLELNFLSQIRALPNPSFSLGPDVQRQPPHPVTLHLSPTSNANVIVTSVSPAPSISSPFVKISADAEVIVAPKTRQKSERGSGRDSRSVASAGRRSVTAKSTASTVRRRSGRDEVVNRGAVFLRGIDRGLEGDWFDDDNGMENSGLKIWVDRELLVTKALRGASWVSVSIVKPTGFQEPIDPQKEPDAEKPAVKIVARLGSWEDAPNRHHAALSTNLCQVLGSEDILGGIVRVEAAPVQVPKASSSGSGKGGLKGLKILPFPSSNSHHGTGLKFGGESKQEREAAAQGIREMYGKSPKGNNLLEGPLTDGMILSASNISGNGWTGGIVKFDPPPSSSEDGGKNPVAWALGSERNLPIEVLPEIPKPSTFFKQWSPGNSLTRPPHLVGIDTLTEQLLNHLSNSSSVLLSGGLGSGKTSVSHLLAYRLRTEYLFHTIYLPCRTLVTDETRVSSIKDTLNRYFASASWGARLGGRSLVILDDLDRLCPVETELQVGGENGRSRHISESICAVVRQYCSIDSGVVVLATAQSKEALNNIIVGGHVVREIVNLKAPNKEGRRKVIEMLVHSDSAPKQEEGHETMTDKDQEWHDDSAHNVRPSTSSSQDKISVDPTIDFLDIAGQTDGYMPGDLVLLVSRARSEALIRSVSASSSEEDIILTLDDFSHALDGFTPASLRNVTLQTSTTRWDSIGGLHTTRQILLETLQYPTTYAPIFSQCPLRLRSGLLLYGYPGCGKTLLASAVAGECGLNFISVKGPEILNKYIGASEKSVRDLFERAEAARPCILFFDEFDSIAPKRGHDSTGVTDRVVNQLLTQMDGAEGLSGVYVLAATSRPDLIDPALLRPGRLDKSLICDMPNLEERIDILKAVTRKLKVDNSVLTSGNEGENLREMARRTEGYSGADLQAVIYNAQLEAIHAVLDDHSEATGNQPNKLPESNKYRTNKTNNAHNAAAKTDPVPSTSNFFHFRYGDNEELGSTSQPTSNSAALIEHTSLATKIQNLQILRRKQREQRHPSQQRSESDFRDSSLSTGNSGSEEPIIQWCHILTSLETTRSSISPQDRKRLETIYREFLVGRDGQLPSGQAGSEIGGRTSLM